jgi:DNA invertase Pin-like site-specific DNA recombinase
MANANAKFCTMNGGQGMTRKIQELELELGKERRTAARDARRARGQSIGRPKALDDAKMALAQADACGW